MIYLLTILVLLFPVVANASTIVAASCSETDVQAAITTAVSGDTVSVPAGSCTWSNSSNYSITTTGKNLIVQGAGIGQTIITSAKPAGKLGLFSITTSDSFRITGFTFQQTGPQGQGANGSAYINISGGGRNIRIDHNAFTWLQNMEKMILLTDVYGVFDHNTVTYNSAIVENTTVTVRLTTFYGGTQGHGSWIVGTLPGSADAFYLEDNTFVRPVGWPSAAGVGVVDCEFGGRFVARYNTLYRSNVNGHGTENSAGYRGCLWREVYNNTFDTASKPSNLISIVAGFRSGTGIISNNAIVNDSTTPSIIQVTRLNNYLRSDNQAVRWGPCDGSNALGKWDKNSSILRDSGTVTSASVVGGSGLAAKQVSDSTKTWIATGGGIACDNQSGAGQWSGCKYSLKNVTQGWSSVIYSNGATTLTYRGADEGNGSALTFAIGDSYEIWGFFGIGGDQCIDEPGTGQSIALAGNAPSVTPAQWAANIVEPIYIWSNTRNGISYNTCIGDHHLASNGACVIGVARPGYATYTYPHPLTAVTPDVLDHIVITPVTSSISFGQSKTYAATGYTASNVSLGDVTSLTTFTIAPDGACVLAVCTPAAAGTYTVTGTKDDKTADATLSVAARSKKVRARRN